MRIIDWSADGCSSDLAAVDHQVRAVAPACRGAGEKGDAARDLFRRAQPPGRLLAQLRLVEFFHRALDHVPIAALELDGTGRDDVHANAVLAMEKRKLLSPGHERSLPRILRTEEHT